MCDSDCSCDRESRETIPTIELIDVLTNLLGLVSELDRDRNSDLYNKVWAALEDIIDGIK